MEKSPVEAAKWFRKAAEQGNVTSQYYLGVMYSAGQGVQQDYVQAHKWFNLAALKGRADAIAYRRELAELMSADEIAVAQREARAWISSH